MRREYECKLCGQIYCDTIREDEYQKDPEGSERLINLRKRIHLHCCPNNLDNEEFTEDE